jgi:phosphohistidine phosphatase
MSAEREKPTDTAGVLLYVIRHAIAAERGPDYPDDSRRPLTPKGVERFRESVAGLIALDVEIDEILTSPYTRARQTAELLAEAFAKKPKITNVHALAEGQPIEVVDTLARFAKRTRLALVGHEPGIGAVTARLLGHRKALAFKKGAVACVEVESLPLSSPGRLLWFIPPRVLRQLGGAK